jgi:chemotaxis protein methyltransferase CheR
LSIVANPRNRLRRTRSTCVRPWQWNQRAKQCCRRTWRWSRLANQGKLSEALTACERAIAAGKLDPDLHYLHAMILQEQSLETEAKAAFDRAVYLDPAFVLAHFSLGNLAQRQGHAAAAQKSFKHALLLLSAFGPDDILPQAEGLSAGRLSQIIHATLQAGALNL